MFFWKFSETFWNSSSTEQFFFPGALKYFQKGSCSEKFCIITGKWNLQLLRVQIARVLLESPSYDSIPLYF